MKISPSAPSAGGLLHAQNQGMPSYYREFAGWLLVVGFILLLTWPGSRD